MFVFLSLPKQEAKEALGEMGEALGGCSKLFQYQWYFFLLCWTPSFLLLFMPEAWLL
jgi:hypothetical protein